MLAGGIAGIGTGSPAAGGGGGLAAAAAATSEVMAELRSAKYCVNSIAFSSVSRPANLAAALTIFFFIEDSFSGSCCW
jgi:hypothetical protein